MSVNMRGAYISSVSACNPLLSCMCTYSVLGGTAGSEQSTVVLQKVPTQGATWPRVYSKETPGVYARRVQRGCNTSVHVGARTLCRSNMPKVSGTSVAHFEQRVLPIHRHGHGSPTLALFSSRPSSSELFRPLLALFSWWASPTPPKFIQFTA